MIDLTSTDDIVFKKLFELIDDEETRVAYQIIYSEHSIKSVDNDIKITWTIWCLDDRDDNSFKSITAAKRVSKEVWEILVKHDTFSEISASISSNSNSDLNQFWDEIEILETKSFFVNWAELPDAVIIAYNEHYIDEKIGAELSEWFGDESIDLNIFPPQIHDMLIRSLKLHWLNEGKEYSARMNFALHCDKFCTFFVPGAVNLSKFPSLKNGIGIISKKRLGAHPFGHLKYNKFLEDIESFKKKGHLVIELQGIFSGENADNSCIGIANISEATATELIGRTGSHIGLYVTTEGVCKIIDLVPK